MDSGSDNSMFLTQNSFRDSQESDNDQGFNFENAELYQNAEPEQIKYQPVVSDISDDELIAATLAVEQHESTSSSVSTATGEIKSRFGRPKNDTEMKTISRRR
jgi:hypothetical protein